MCGIAGFAANGGKVLESALSIMQETLKHRGPDGQGMILFNDVGRPCREKMSPVAGLAHTRLSILDLSSAGAQPMANETGDVWISFNGECYNFAEFREDLLARGHIFTSRTDTEVLLHYYEEYGLEDLVNKINGMFALAIWDGPRRRMLLARDRLGKKPLYYIHQADGSLVFASEIKAFVAAGLVDKDDIDREALHQFWMYGYAAHDLTIYTAVRKLPPAHYAVWEHGYLSVHEYWDCPFDPEPPQRTTADLAEELEFLLCDAIRLRLIADVPVGLFLSGGIDSSLICALTAKVAGTDIQTFTIEFAQAAFNEAPYAAAVSRHLGLANTPLRVTDDLQADFENIARHFDEPFGDSSSIPTYYVSKLARQHVTVALTGDAGDELFAGYDAYAKGLRLWGSLRQRLLFARKTPWANLLVDSPKMFLPREKWLIELEKVVPDRIRKQVLTEFACKGIDEEALCAQRNVWLKRVDGCDLLSRMQYLNIKSYLPDDILVKVDRMSMAHGLECRSPFLDYRIVEFAAGLPYSAKIDRTGKQKLLLRSLLKQYVPEHFFSRPKAGFCVPWADWCRSGLGTTLRTQWQTMHSPYFNPGAAEILFPTRKLGWTGWQWSAFVSMVFFDA